MSQRISESEQVFRYSVRSILFLSSYVPLFFIIALKIGTTKPLLIENIFIPQFQFEFIFSWVSTLIVVFCIFISAILYHVMDDQKESSVVEKSITNYQRRNDLLSMYLLSYVFVFAGLAFSNPIDIVVFVIFFSMLGVLQIRSEILHINPMLGINGYNTYSMTCNGRTILVITQGQIEKKMDSCRGRSESPQENVEAKIELVPLGGTTYLAP